jgi:hypothetical protein
LLSCLQIARDTKLVPSTGQTVGLGP